MYRDMPKDNARLTELLRRAKDHKMTPEEIQAQRESWVRGNVGLSRMDRGEGVTRVIAGNGKED